MDKSLAGSGTLGDYTPVQLFAGEQDVVTDRALCAAGLIFAQFEVVAVDATDQIIKYDPAAAAGAPEGQPVGALLHAMNTSATGTNEPSWCPYYSGGFFNHEALVWPAGTDTLAQRKAAFKRTNISIGTVL